MFPNNIIYALVDPRTGTPPRYIGCSTVGLKRPKRHKNANMLNKEATNPHKKAWIKKMLREAGEPFIVVLQDFPENTPLDVIHAAEIKWIAFGRSQGWDLTNATNGGEGNKGMIVSERTKELYRKRSREYWSKQENREAASKRTKGIPLGYDHSKKISEAKKGRLPYPNAIETLRKGRESYPQNTPEARARMSESQRNPKTIAKRSATIARKKELGLYKPYVRSEQQCAEHSEKMKGNSFARGHRHSDEVRARMSASHTGKKRSPETIAKVVTTRARKKAERLAVLNQTPQKKKED